MSSIPLKWWIVIIIGGIGLIAGGSMILTMGKKSQISNFEDCKKAGFPVLQSFPEQCVANGRTFSATE